MNVKRKTLQNSLSIITSLGCSLLGLILALASFALFNIRLTMSEEMPIPPIIITGVAGLFFCIVGVIAFFQLKRLYRINIAKPKISGSVIHPYFTSGLTK